VVYATRGASSDESAPQAMAAPTAAKAQASAHARRNHPGPAFFRARDERTLREPVAICFFSALEIPSRYHRPA